jgi:hypothetical protein
LTAVRECLVRIKALLEIPLSAQQAIWFAGTSLYPNAEELEANFQALRETVSLLEPMVIELGQAMAAAKAGEHAQATAAEAEEVTDGTTAKRGPGPADRQALAAYERALQLMGEAGKDATDQKVYDWICEHELGGDLEDYRPPAFESWRRCRNRARQERDANRAKEDPLTPRSAVNPKDL